LPLMAFSKKVLIVDDEMDSCLLLKSFLTQLDYEVSTALTLTEGMKLLIEVSPDIIFLDNNLPDGLGWERIDYIHSSLPKCKINLVSAYHYDFEKLKGKDVHIIPKPLSLSKIKEYLKN
jgi:two-component system, OmpR family, response regulator